MASYGKKMLEAALEKVRDNTGIPTRQLRPPSNKVKCQDKVEQWLSASCTTADEEDSTCIDQSSVSEYQPSECSGSDQEHEEYVSESTLQENSVAYPMLQAQVMEEQLPGDFEHKSAHSVPVECSTGDATETYSRTTLSRSQIRKAFERVTVAGDPKSGSKRNYSKPDYCLFCKAMYRSKISSHYLSVHTKETKVKNIMALPCGSKERKRSLTLLRNEGNHHHNCEVLQNGCGEITVSRRPVNKDASRPELYVPCSECKAWVFERSLSTHSLSCPAGKTPDKNLLRNSRMLISPFITLDTDKADIEDLIIKMKETSKHPGLRNICMRDVLIKEFCRGLLHKLGSVDEQRRKDKDNIRTKLRTVGRLLINLNAKTKEEFELSRYITPKYFMLIVNTVKEMGKHSPNLSLTLGHYIKQICELKQSLALQSEDEEAKRDASNFNLLLGAHWNNYVSAVTLRRLKLRTLNKSMELPKTSDMVKLKDFLDSEISNSLIRQKLSSQQWSETAQALMVRILLFNKRRVSEVEEMKVSDIVQAQNGSDSEEMLSQMDITEKALAKRMTVIEVRGKSTRGLRKVFVILSDQMLKACQHLIQTRMYVGINPSVVYLFSRPCGSALDGCKAMRDVTSRCPGLESPELIRTRLLRKYLATTIQLLDMTGDELKMVADHMGHSVAIHTDVYRLQTSLLERTKVARALIALENGQLNKFAGRNLSACSFEELPMPIVEQDEQDEQDLSVTGDVADTVSDGVDSNKGLKRTLTCEGTEDDEDLPTNVKKSQTRKRWNEEEEARIITHFNEHIIAKRNPSGKEIRQAQEKCPCLKERSVAMIKSKVNNIILGKCKAGLFK